MSWGQGTSWAWRKVRADVLKRDEYVCQLRLVGCYEEATEAHHTQSISAARQLRADAIDPDVCIAVCHHCHRLITAQQARDAIHARSHRKPRTHPLDA